MGIKNTFLKSITFVLLLSLGTSLLAAGKHDPHAVDSLIAVGIEYSRHGQFEESNAVFNGLLKDYALSKKQKREVWKRLATNADLAGVYPAYAQYLSLLEGKKKPSDDLQTAMKMSLLPLQQLERPSDDVSVSYLIDSLYYNDEYAGCEIRLPVIIGGQAENLILDNGCAKFSVASESFALSHGIRNIGADGNAVGTVDRVSMWFGVADSLMVGGLKFRNIIFVVIPDQFLANPILDINAMLGANIFRLAGEMVFDNQKRTITFPEKALQRESNLLIDSEGTHLAVAEIDGGDVLMNVDLGAAHSALNANYYLQNTEKVQSTCHASGALNGGVGGTKMETVYAMPELVIHACGGTFVVPNASISTQKSGNVGDECGTLGNDFLLSFRKVVLNLAKMYLWVE